MNICIYGSGLIGMSLANEYSELGYSIFVISNKYDETKRQSSEHKNIKFFDLNSILNDKILFKSFRVLIFCKHNDSRSTINVDNDLLKITNLSIKLSIPKVILISSVSVYGDAIKKISNYSNNIISSNLMPEPISFYGKSTLTRELELLSLFKKSAVNFNIVRIPMVIDKSMRVKLFKYLHKFLKYGFFLYPGTLSSSLPCIRSSILALKLRMLFNQTSSNKIIYQFSEKLNFICIFNSYGVKLNKNIFIIFIPIFFLNLIKFINIKKINYFLDILSNNVIYQDDLFHTTCESIPLDEKLINILWSFLDNN
jgi:hypothetical protein